VLNTVHRRKKSKQSSCLISLKLLDFWLMLCRQASLLPNLLFSHYAADPGWSVRLLNAKNASDRGTI
jgi:hypothetical protein